MLRVLSLSTFLLGITTVVNYSAFVVFARTGGVTAFSQYLYDLTIAGVLSIIINYSSQRIYTRDVLESKSEQNSFNAIMTVRLILGIIGIVALILWGLMGSAITPLSAVFLVFYIFQLNFLFEYFSMNIQLAVVTLIEKSVFAAIALTWTLTYGFTWHVYTFFLLSSLIAIALQCRFHKALVSNFSFSAAHDTWRYLKRYLSLTLMDIVQLTYGNFSRLIIQQKKGLLEFGAVSIGFQIIKLASIFQTQAEYIFRPQTVRMAEVGDTDGLKRHALKYLWMTTLPTALGSVILILIAEPLILFGFGEDYSAAVPALKIISILPITINLMRFVEMIFIGLSHYRTTLTLNIVTSLMLMVGLILVPATASTSVFLWLIVGIQVFYVLALSILAAKRLKSQQTNRTGKNDQI